MHIKEFPKFYCGLIKLQYMFPQSKGGPYGSFSHSEGQQGHPPVSLLVWSADSNFCFIKSLNVVIGCS